MEDPTAGSWTTTPTTESSMWWIPVIIGSVLGACVLVVFLCYLVIRARRSGWMQRSERCQRQFTVPPRPQPLSYKDQVAITHGPHDITETPFAPPSYAVMDSQSKGNTLLPSSGNDLSMLTYHEYVIQVKQTDGIDENRTN